jgi:type II secretory pathway pseudopilin PulG
MKQCDNENAFTLMEAIVAIFVITTGLVGVLSLVSQTIAASTFSKDKLIAAYLAQEGIEIVRNIRDTNWLQSLDWDNGLAFGIYEADYDSQSLSGFSGNPLNLESLTNYYGYGSGNATKFTRKITISKVDPADTSPYYRKNVKVEVFWQEKGTPHKVEAQENLYNWK